jgi:hypothetical protein
MHAWKLFLHLISHPAAKSLFQAMRQHEFGTELYGFVLASSLPEAWLTWHGLEGHGERERERARESERESSLRQSVKILACEISHKALAML